MDGQQQVGPGCFGCGGTLAGLQVGAAVGGQQGRKAVIRRQFLAQQLGGAQCDVALPHAVGLTAPVLGPDVGVDAPVPGVDGHHILPRRGGLGGRLRLRRAYQRAPQRAAARRWRAGGCRRTALSPRPRTPAAQPPHTAAAAPFWPGVCGGSGAAFPAWAAWFVRFWLPYRIPPFAYRCIVHGGCYRVVSVL